MRSQSELMHIGIYDLIQAARRAVKPYICLAFRMYPERLMKSLKRISIVPSQFADLVRRR